MKQPSSAMDGAPSPQPSTDKRYYQSRHTFSGSLVSHMPFKDTMENGERKLDYGALVMSYTDINNRGPNAMERGVPISQDEMGAGGNRLVHEKKFG